MSGRSHWRYVADGRGLAEDEQDVVGQPVAGVLEQEPDYPLDRSVQVGQGQRRGYLVVQVEERPPRSLVSLPWLPAQHVRDKIDFPSKSRCACNFMVN